MRDTRAAIGLMFAVMSPVILGIAALIVDTGFWFAGRALLQVRADAAAMGAAYVLRQANFLSLAPADQLLTAQAIATVEAEGVSSRLFVSIGTPEVLLSGSTVKVTLRSQASSYFANVFNIGPPLLRATATAAYPASTPCVLSLAITGVAALLDNSATVSAALCAVTVNASMVLNSGTLSATAVNVVGSVTLQGGGNFISPAATAVATAGVDPYATRVPPTPGSCSVANLTAYGQYVVSPTTWCGATTIGGNGSTITFNPGVYTVVGDLTFNNASITSANGVTFVVTGNLSWTNYSNTSTQIIAPTTGTTAGIAFWQPCKLGQTSSFQGGSTLLVTGAIYSPCAAADIGNNAQVAAPLGQNMSFISSTLHVHGSAALRAAAAGGGGGGSPVLVE